MQSKLIALFLLLLTISATLISITTVRAEDEVDEDVDVLEETDDATKHATQGGAQTGQPAGTSGASGVAGEAGDDDEYEDVEDVEESVSVLQPSPDALTSVLFTNFPDRRFVQGDIVTILIGFHNNGQKTFNITHVGASLRSPFDYSYIIQNLTSSEVGLIVESGREVSIEYKFRADTSLEPLEFWLSGWILYNNSDHQIFTSAFYNATIEFVEKPNNFDARQVFSYFLMAAVGGLVVYIFFQFSSGGKKSKRSGRSSARQQQESNSSWDTEIYTPKERAKKAGNSQKRKKKTSS